MNEVIIYPDKKEISSPIVFLAGPIKGAPLWQNDAITILKNLDNICIISPRTEDKKQPSETELIQKMDWETVYLNQASKNGAILFWFAKRISDIASQSYAKASRFELAEWKERYRFSKFNLVVGIEPGFEGELYIRRRLNVDCPEVQIFSELEKTCKEAMRLVSK